jgi:hypothetical protein
MAGDCFSVTLVEIEEFGKIKCGTQIAVKRSFEKLHKSLKVFYRAVSSEKYFYHHGVFIHDDHVVHFAGESKAEAKPRTCSLLQFFRDAEDGKLYQVNYDDPSAVLPVEETAKNIAAVLSNPEKWPEYDPLKNNCETFATWLKTAKRHSNQGVKVQSRLEKVEKGCMISGIVLCAGTCLGIQHGCS